MSADLTFRAPRGEGLESPTGTTKAGPRGWVALVVLMLPVLMVSMDNTVLSFALPEISSALSPSGTALLWVVDVYALMLAGLLIAMGSLGDRIGRRRLLIGGAIGFGVVSVLAAYSPNTGALIAGRALLGVFGATLMPSTLSLLRNIFLDRRERRLAIAVWAGGFSGGAALGPVAGGWLLQHFWWGSIFLINVPVILVLVPLALWLVPESKNPAPGPLDPIGIALSMTAMLPIVYAIKTVAEHGFTGAAFLAIGIGVASGFAFVHRQLELEHPLIDVRLFTNKVFSGALMSNLLSIMALAGFLYFSSQFLQLVMGLAPMDAAMVLVPGLIATIIAGLVAVRLVQFIPAHLLVSLSFVLSAAGYAIAAFLGEVPTTWTIMTAFVVLGIGIGIAETLTNDLIIASVPPHRAGAASAISETAYEIGAVLGTAVLGGILTASYRAGVVIPQELSGDKAAKASETLGSAHEAAAGLSDYARQVLLDSANAAFDLGVQRTSAVAILIALGAAAVAYTTLRDAD